MVPEGIRTEGSPRRLSAWLLRTYLDLGPVTSGPLHVRRVEECWHSFSDLTSPVFSPQRAFAPAFRSELIDESGRPEYAVSDPRELPHEFRTPRWQDVCDALDQWATLQSDTNARTRLLGLRNALRVIIYDLGEHRIPGKDTLAPVFVHGIESYLAEPADSDTELIQLLFRLWSLLEGIEELMRIAPLGSELAKAQVPHIQELAKHALPLSKQILEAVDATIETMNPLT